MKGVITMSVALAVAFLAVARGQELRCIDVKVDIIPCFPYITRQRPQPGKECCDAFRSLKRSASSIADKRTACICLKEAVNKLPVQVQGQLIGLPNRCGAPLSFPISTDINCDTIH